MTLVSVAQMAAPLTQNSSGRGWLCALLATDGFHPAQGQTAMCDLAIGQQT